VSVLDALTTERKHTLSALHSRTIENRIATAKNAKTMFRRFVAILW